MPADGQSQQRLIAVFMLGCGIGPVGEQREMQIAFRAGKMVNLQTFDQFLDRRWRCQQRRHRDQRAQMRGNAVAQFQRGQQGGAKAKSDGAIDQRDRGIERGDEPKKPEQS